MKTESNKLPLAARILLKTLLDKNERGFLSDDYEFFYNKYCEEKGRARAFIWLILNILKSMPGFVFENFIRGNFMFRNYFKIAIRTIKRQKLFSAINILGLATGMACTVLILFWVMDELSYDKFHENADNIFTVISTDTHAGKITKETTITPPVLAKTLVAEFPEVAAGSRFMPTGWAIKYGEGLENIYMEGGAFADAEFFRIFKCEFIHGGGLQLEEPASIVITDKMAAVCFGNKNPIGEKLVADNNLEFEVTGVIKSFPVNSTIEFDFLIPFKTIEKYGFDSDSWESKPINTYFLTHPNTDAKILNRKITGLIKGHLPESVTTLSLLKITDMHLHQPGSGALITYVYIFTAIAFFILIIASINFMNLSIAKSSNRAKEVGIRKTLGAVRKELIVQYLSESIFLSFFSILISIVFVIIALPVFNDISGKEIILKDLIDIRFFFLLLAVMFLTGACAGIYPAFFLSAFNPNKVLKGSFSKGAGSSFLRNVLLSVQYTLAIILMISTSVIYSQFQYIDDKDLGYDPELLLAARMMYGNPEYPSIKSELLQHPGVLNVTATDVPVLFRSLGYTYDVNWQGKDPSVKIEFETRVADIDYFETFNMQLSEGRSFSKDYSTDTSSFIINETAVALIGFNQSINNQITVEGKTGNIIGVVKDFHSNSLYDQIKPLVVSYQPKHCKWVCVKISSHEIAATLEFLKIKWGRLDPGYEFEYSFLDDRINNMYRADLRMSKLFSYFTLLAIIISCLGLVGLSAFLAEQKRKEISIRKVLGAPVATIIKGFSANFLKYVLLANVFAWPLAYFSMTNWLRNFAYRTNMSFMDFIFPAVFALFIAVVTISYQAIKSANINPATNLRNE